MNWEKFLESMNSSRSGKFFEHIKEIKKEIPQKPASTSAGSELVTKIKNTMPAERAEVLYAHVIQGLVNLLRLDSPSQVDPNKGFIEIGVDSLAAIEFRNILKKSLGPDFGKLLPPTLVFDYPNVNAVVEFLLKEVLVFSEEEIPLAESVTVKSKKIKIDNEPIAIIGSGCRLPGGISNLDELWEALKNGRDLITEIPKERWDINQFYDADVDAPGKIVTRSGGFIKNAEMFDALFFEISAPEADETDPQQRLLLESTWEALEDAGESPDKLRGSRTGVFFGGCSFDYGRLHAKKKGQELSGYYGIGTLAPGLAGRVSYFFGFQGPSFVIDTACSSSLLAVHQACMSLRTLETDMALAGGVNLILTPDVFISFSRAHMLAPDGRCKTFDESADGYARSEGCGVLVLKRLSDAVANGDQILAVIRGTAANQDGRSSTLTSPNGPSQEALIRESLANGGVEASDVSYFEAHGTGTSLGDPIEVNALGKVLKAGRSQDQVLMIGSIKTNLGHAEAAAGVTGLLKIIAAMKNKAIPPHLHFKNLNSKISLENIPAKIITELTPWTSLNKPRIASISSYGFTGTNVNAVLEEGPIQAMVGTSDGNERDFQILNLSAKSESALLEMVGRYQDFFNQKLNTTPEESLEQALTNICFTANTGRAHLNERISIVAKTKKEFQEKLLDLSLGKIVPASFRGKTNDGLKSKLVLLFSGQGSQYVGMGKRLYETEKIFKSSLDQCAELLKKYLDKPLLQILFDEAKDLESIHQTKYTQPSLFALEYSLYQLWKSWGIRPAVVMGHSVGELVAACVAGVFSLEDGIKLIAKRAELMSQLPGLGSMAVVQAREKRVLEAIHHISSKISIAAINGPENIVISGEIEFLEPLLSQFEKEGVRVTRLKVSHAFHSSQMDPMLDEFEKVASEIKFSPPQIRLMSNVTGQKAEASEITQAGYWRRHIREAVRFEACIVSAFADGCRDFLEIGPGTTLTGMAQQCLPDEADVVCKSSLHKDRNDWQQILEALGGLYVRGVAIDWKAFETNSSQRRKVSLPTYPFQRQAFWLGELGMKNDPKEADLNIKNKKAVDLKSIIVEKLSESHTETERRKTLYEYTENCIKLLLRINPETLLDPNQNLSAFGIDSLLSVEFRNKVKAELQIAKNIPASFLLENASLQMAADALFIIFSSNTEPSTQLKKQPVVPTKSTALSQWLPLNSEFELQKNHPKLFCFHYAGGSAEMFKALGPMVSSQFTICPVQLPGRANRFKDKIHDNLDDLINDFHQVTAAFLNEPFAVLGYSMGSLVAFEFARLLQAKGNRHLKHAFFAGQLPPNVLSDLSQHQKFGVKDLSDDDFINRLTEMGLLKNFMSKEDLKQVALPMLRADFGIIDKYIFQNSGPLEIPLTIFAGETDTLTPFELMAQWKDRTRSKFKVEKIPGGHYFIHTHLQEFADKILANWRDS